MLTLRERREFRDQLDEDIHYYELVDRLEKLCDEVRKSTRNRKLVYTRLERPLEILRRCKQEEEEWHKDLYGKKPGELRPTWTFVGIVVPPLKDLRSEISRSTRKRGHGKREDTIISGIKTSLSGKGSPFGRTIGRRKRSMSRPKASGHD
jgi:hypothetical protein